MVDLPTRRVAWYARATPRKLQALDAAQWRRRTEERIFRGDNDPSYARGATFGEVASGKADEQRRPFGSAEANDESLFGGAPVPPPTPEELRRARSRGGTYEERLAARGVAVPAAVKAAQAEPQTGPPALRSPYDPTATELAKPGGFAAALISGEANLRTMGIDSSRLPRGLREAVDVGAAPLTWATAGFGGEAGAAIRGTRIGAKPVGRLAASLIEPVGVGSFGRRLATEVVAGTTGLLGAQEAGRRLEGAPAPVRVLGSVAGGLAGGLTGLAATRAAPAAARQAGRGARAYRDVTRNIPIGASIKDVSEGGLIREIDPDELKFRPDLFQARDVPEGEAFDPKRVRELAAKWDEAQFTPPLVAHDTRTGELVVLGGHHRTAAAQLAKAEGKKGASTIPYRRIDLDLSNPQDVARAQGLAAMDNLQTKELNVREQYQGLRAISASGVPDDQLAESVAGAMRPSRVQDVLDIGDAGPAVLDRVVVDRQLEGIAAEVGRAKRTWGLSDEESGGWFNLFAGMGKGRSLPSRAIVREQLDAAGRAARAAGVEQGDLFGGGMFEGMGKNPVQEAFVERTRLTMKLDRENKQLTDELKKVTRLTSRLVGDPEAQGASAVLVDRAEREIARTKAAIADIDQTVAERLRSVAQPSGAEPPPAGVRAPAGGAALEQFPEQGGLPGVARNAPTYRPEGAGREAQAGLGIGAGEQPIETAGPMFAGAPPVSEGAPAARAGVTLTPKELQNAARNVGDPEQAREYLRMVEDGTLKLDAEGMQRLLRVAQEPTPVEAARRLLQAQRAYRNADEVTPAIQAELDDARAARDAIYRRNGWEIPGSRPAPTNLGARETPQVPPPARPPAPQEDTVRLYRGEGAAAGDLPTEGQGRWFTPSQDEAAVYGRETPPTVAELRAGNLPTENVQAVDVPRDVYEAARQQGGAQAILPPEWAARARPVSELPNRAPGGLEAFTPPLGDLRAPQPPAPSGLPGDRGARQAALSDPGAAPQEISAAIDELVAAGEPLPPRPAPAAGPSDRPIAPPERLLATEFHEPQYRFPGEPDPAPAAPAGGRMVEAAQPPTGGGGRRPPRPPTTPPPKPPGADHEARMLALLDELIPGEPVDNELLRRLEGTLKAAGLEIEHELDAGNRMLRGLGVGKRIGNVRAVEGTPEMVALRTALHGEGPVPPRFQAVYDELRRWVDWEQADRIDFDPDAAQIEDYFSRGWRPVELSPDAAERRIRGSGGFGARPQSEMRRTDAKFTTLLNTTWTRGDGSQFKLEPWDWNPFGQAALRRVNGVRYRAQMTLLEHLKVLEQAVSVKLENEIPSGWSVPRIGPAFEGTKVPTVAADGTKGWMTVNRHAVPDRVANTLENQFGRIRHEEGVISAVEQAAQFAKNAKLFGSFFQQADFATRSGGSSTAAALDDLMHGKPVSAVAKVMRIPRNMVDMAAANLLPNRRVAWREKLLSEEPWVKGRKISARGILEQGWNVSGDTTSVATDITSTLRSALEDGRKFADANLLRQAQRRFVNMNTSVKNGLFHGTYRVAQYHSLRDQIVPRLIRQHPEWSDTQIMADAARQVNIMYSSLGEYQQVLRNQPALREIAHNMLFSTNEMEALLKQAGSALGVTNRRNSKLWAQNTMGSMLFLAAVAETVHFAATRKPLPLDRFVPVTIERDEYGARRNPFNPLNWSYNSTFLSPNVPLLHGRAGLPISLDLMGQLDTAFRVLDPTNFIAARVNVLPRAGWNQIRGKDFYGRPIDQVGPLGIVSRAQQAAVDIGLPIGATNVAAATGAIPEQEGRLGVQGQLAQATGFNFRAASNAELLQRLAGGRDWQSLSGGEQQRLLAANPEMKAELDRRTATSAERGNRQAAARVERDKIDEKRVADEGAAWARLMAKQDDLRTFRERYSDIQRNAALEKQRVNTDYKAFKDDGKLPSDPGRRAYVQWLDLFDQYKLPGGAIDWERFDPAEDALLKGLDERSRAFVEDRTKLDHHPDVQGWVDLRKYISESGYWDARDEAVQRAVTKYASRAPAGFVAPKTMDEVAVRKRIAVESGNRAELLAIERVRSAAEKFAKDAQEKLRKENPDLDQAYIYVYGGEPVRRPASGAGFGATSRSGRETRPARAPTLRPARAVR